LEQKEFSQAHFLDIELIDVLELKLLGFCESKLLLDIYEDLVLVEGVSEEHIIRRHDLQIRTLMKRVELAYLALLVFELLFGMFSCQ